MEGDDVVSAVRESCATELDRLGSEKSLVAATAAQLDRETVLASAATAEARARDTFTEWAEDTDHPDAHDAFEAVAETERTHYERVADLLKTPPTVPAPDTVHEYLRGLEDPAERVGAGLVGRPLVAERSLLQVINFFVNEGDRQRADLFRELRSDTGDTVDRGADLLDSVCDDEAAYERAHDAAVETIERAYEEYANDLEELGIDPKPVC